MPHRDHEKPKELSAERQKQIAGLVQSYMSRSEVHRSFEYGVVAEKTFHDYTRGRHLSTSYDAARAGFSGGLISFLNNNGVTAPEEIRHAESVLDGLVGTAVAARLKSAAAADAARRAR